MKTFAQNLMKLAPDWVTLPLELIETFDWLEDQGWLNIRGTALPEEHTLMIYPPEQQNQPFASHMAFGGTSLPYTGHWSTPDPAIDNRITEIGETAGDGGRVAIWLDNEGKQQFVHIGHDTIGTITDDPRVLLQFLAMGYLEAGGLEQTNVTPIEAFLEYHGVETLSDLGPDEQPVPPIAFQGFLKQRFDLDMPRTARDIGINDFATYHADHSTDPFVQWIIEIQPEPTEAELAYELELMRTVESLNLQDDDDTDTIMQKIGSLFKSKDNDK